MDYTPEAKEKVEKLDEILAMARWKSENVMKQLKPLSRAANAVEKASKDSKIFSEKNKK